RRGATRRPASEISDRTGTPAKEIKITTNRQDDHEPGTNGPRADGRGQGRRRRGRLHLWVDFMVTNWHYVLISSDKLRRGDLHPFPQRTVMTRGGEETVVDWQDADTMAAEPAHD